MGTYELVYCVNSFNEATGEIISNVSCNNRMKLVQIGPVSETLSPIINCNNLRKFFVSTAVIENELDLFNVFLSVSWGLSFLSSEQYEQFTCIRRPVYGGGLVRNTGKY